MHRPVYDDSAHGVWSCLRVCFFRLALWPRIPRCMVVVPHPPDQHPECPHLCERLTRCSRAVQRPCVYARMSLAPSCACMCAYVRDCVSAVAPAPARRADAVAAFVVDAIVDVLDLRCCHRVAVAALSLQCTMRSLLSSRPR